MDALAEKWSRSGQRSEDLYKGKTDEIIKALKSWIAARNARNEANLKLLWQFFENNYDIVERRNEYGTIDDVRIAPFKAKHVKMVERVQEFKKERDKLTLHAHFLLSTLSHRGFRWSRLPCTPEWTEIDSEVCAFLKTQDQKFDDEKELEFLEMKEEIGEWRLEHARREAIEAARMVEEDDANDRSVSRPHHVTAVGFLNPADFRGSPANYGLPAPVDVTGLIPPPRPHAEDSPTGSLSCDTLNAIDEECAEKIETEETAEAIALRINDSNASEDKKVDKRSKNKKRNIQRKKARARAQETTNKEVHAGGEQVD